MKSDESNFMLGECPNCGKQFVKRSLGENHVCNSDPEDDSGRKDKRPDDNDRNKILHD